MSDSPKYTHKTIFKPTAPWDVLSPARLVELLEKNDEPGQQFCGAVMVGTSVCGIYRRTDQ